MDNLFPLFFALYILGSIISAVMKRRQGEEDGPPERNQPSPRRAPAERPQAEPEKAPEMFPPRGEFPPFGPLPPPFNREPTQESAPAAPRVPVPDLPTAMDAVPAEPEWVQQRGGVPEKVDVRDVRETTEVAKRRSKRLAPQDVRRGILLAELLDAPRARRPYRPPGLGTFGRK